MRSREELARYIESFLEPMTPRLRFSMDEWLEIARALREPKLPDPEKIEPGPIVRQSPDKDALRREVFLRVLPVLLQMPNSGAEAVAKKAKAVADAAAEVWFGEGES